MRQPYREMSQLRWSDSQTCGACQHDIPRDKCMLCMRAGNAGLQRRRDAVFTSIVAIIEAIPTTGRHGSRWYARLAANAGPGGEAVDTSANAYFCALPSSCIHTGDQPKDAARRPRSRRRDCATSWPPLATQPGASAGTRSNQRPAILRQDNECGRYETAPTTSPDARRWRCARILSRSCVARERMSHVHC